MHNKDHVAMQLNKSPIIQNVWKKSNLQNTPIPPLKGSQNYILISPIVDAIFIRKKKK